jgi:hypothetical protein
MLCCRLSVLVSLLTTAFVTKLSAAGFLTAQPYPAGTLPTTGIVADVNNDGLPDLVVGNQYTSRVSVFLGRPNGTFGRFRSFPAGRGVSEIAVGDFNKDGRVDLATTDAFGAVNILLGNGDGTFAAPASVPLDYNPQGIKTADLNGDGNLDLVIAIVGADEPGEGELAVLLGNGDGSFRTPVYYPAGQNAMSVALADLNGDGKLDAAVADENCCVRNSLSVLLGNGDGTFQHAVSSIPGTASDVAAGDLNGDGKIDLVLAGEFGGLIQVALGNGDGTFQPATVYPTPDSALTVKLADLNGDGSLDIAVGGSSGVDVLLGKGDGSFRAATAYGVGSQFVALGDFNNDGVLDAAAGGSSFVGVAFGNPDGSFAAAREYSVETLVRDLVSGDFNGDKIDDIVVTRQPPLNTMQVLLGNGHGGLTGGAAFSNITQAFLITGDFNGDSKLDLSASGDGADIFIYLGNGDGTFQTAKRTALSDPNFQVTGDFNGDGKLDLAVSNTFANKVSVLIGHGDGFFDPAVKYPSGHTPQGIVAADFNLDGKLDLAVANTSSGTVGIYLGNGDGTFQAAMTMPVSDALYMGEGDFNGDGKPDIVVSAGTETVLLLGNGDGTFQSPQFTLNVQGSIAIADVNNDGDLDVAVSDRGLAHVALGNGDGTFRPDRSFFIGTLLAGPLVFANLNRDTHPDLVVSDDSDHVSVLVSSRRPRSIKHEFR